MAGTDCWRKQNGIGVEVQSGPVLHKLRRPVYRRHWTGHWRVQRVHLTQPSVTKTSCPPFMTSSGDSERERRWKGDEWFYYSSGASIQTGLFLQSSAKAVCCLTVTNNKNKLLAPQLLLVSFRLMGAQTINWKAITKTFIEVWFPK